MDALQAWQGSTCVNTAGNRIAEDDAGVLPRIACSNGLINHREDGLLRACEAYPAFAVS
jgi:hypothetical protein